MHVIMKADFSNGGIIHDYIFISSSTLVRIRVKAIIHSSLDTGCGTHGAAGDQVLAVGAAVDTVLNTARGAQCWSCREHQHRDEEQCNHSHLVSGHQVYSGFGLACACQDGFGLLCSEMENGEWWVFVAGDQGMRMGHDSWEFVAVCERG